MAKARGAFCGKGAEKAAWIQRLESYSESPMELARARLDLLQVDSGVGFSAAFFQPIRRCFEDWFREWSGKEDGNNDKKQESFYNLREALSICDSIARHDAVLAEEFARDGLHALLCRLLRCDSSGFQDESDQDSVIELQDLAGSIAASSSSFPINFAPFSREELLSRLPLSFRIAGAEFDSANDTTMAPIEILINQVTERQSAQEDVGFVMWPSAVVLSRWLLSNQNLIRGRSVMEIGAGCGLTGLVAAFIQKRLRAKIGDEPLIPVLLTDFNKLVLDNLQRNVRLNDLQNYTSVAGLDFYRQEGDDCWIDMEFNNRTQVEVIIGADIICQVDDSYAAARTIRASLVAGGKAVIVCADSAHRFGVGCFPEACESVGLVVESVVDVRELYGGRLMNPPSSDGCSDGDDLSKTTGYVESMRLKMFMIIKR